MLCAMYKHQFSHVTVKLFSNEVDHYDVSCDLDGDIIFMEGRDLCHKNSAVVSLNWRRILSRKKSVLSVCSGFFFGYTLLFGHPLV